MTELAVFGASGRTGHLVVDVALSRGMGVRALVRPNADCDARPGFEVLRGSLDEGDDVTATLSGTTAACCVFGPRVTSQAPFCARATAQVIAAMKVTGVQRLVGLTGAMVGDLPPNVSLAMRVLAHVYRRRVPDLAADATEQERLVMASGLDWTLAKPPRLTDATPTGRVRADPALRVGLSSRVGRGDLAVFLVDEMTHARHLRQRVYVSS